MFQEDGEVTCGATVGRNGVTNIVKRIEHGGGIWFDVFEGKTLSRSLNSRHIAEIQYASEDGQ